MSKYLTYFLLIFITTINLLADQVSEEPIEVRFVTTYGTIDIILFHDKAPITVDNFLKYVDAGHYDNGTFKRTVRYDNDNGDPKIEVIQGGARIEISRYAAIPIETTKQTGILHTNGVISMARSDPDTAQDEFFITIGDQPSLDFGGMRNKDGQGFAAFGIVIRGMEVVRKINAIRETKDMGDAYTKGQYLTQPVKIIRVFRNGEKGKL